MNWNIEEYHESALVLWKYIPPVIFHTDVPEFSRNILTER